MPPPIASARSARRPRAGPPMSRSWPSPTCAANAATWRPSISRGFAPMRTTWSSSMARQAIWISSTSPPRRRSMPRWPVPRSAEGCTSCARSRWPPPSPTRATCSSSAVVAKRVLYPCHNYKHAPVIRNVRKIIDSGAIGQVHLVTLQTFRNTHARGVPEWRPDWRREKRHSGRRYRDGPRQPHLLLGLRVDAGLSHGNLGPHVQHQHLRHRG